MKMFSELFFTINKRIFDKILNRKVQPPKNIKPPILLFTP